MTRDELLKYHCDVCSEAKDLMALKNRDYAGSEGTEPFANFTRVESLGICSTEQGFMTRVTDKISRLSSFLNSGKMHVEDESFSDTIVDVINYMVLLSAYVSDKESVDNTSKVEKQLLLEQEYQKVNYTSKDTMDGENWRDNGF